MKLTEERVIPLMMNPKSGMLQEHIARYHFTKQFVRGRVLDIACGVGYGAEILCGKKESHLVDRYVGVDIDPESIAYAKENYNYPRAEYLIGNALSKNLPDQLGLFDTIISFETVEHIKDDMLFIQNISRMLKPKGVLIISTPFGRGRGILCTNPYHVHQYKEEEFFEILKPFSSIEMYHQIDTIIEKPIAEKKYYLMVAVCSNLQHK